MSRASLAIILVLFISGLSFTSWILLYLSPRLRHWFWPRNSFVPPPWRFVEVCAVWAALTLLLLLVNAWWALLQSSRWENQTRTSPWAQAGKESPEDFGDRAHWVILLISHHPDLSTLLLVLVSAGILGPVAEEVIFRLFLQGWLHAKEIRWRQGSLRRLGAADDIQTLDRYDVNATRDRLFRRPTQAGRRLPPGICAVAVTTLIFALLHARSVEHAPDSETIRSFVTQRTIAYFLFLVLVFFFALQRDSHFWWRLGLRGKKAWSDIGLGLGWFAASVLPIYGTQYCLTSIVPRGIVVDPLSILIVGAILGTLYARTGRLLPSIVFHMSLNFTSLIVAWAAAVVGQ